MSRAIQKRKTDKCNARFVPVAKSMPSLLYLNASLARETEWNNWISFQAVSETFFLMAT